MNSQKLSIEFFKIRIFAEKFLYKFVGNTIFFLIFCYPEEVRRYEERHSRLINTGEAKMINSYAPALCPFCHTNRFVKIGEVKERECGEENLGRSEAGIFSPLLK